MWRRGVLGLGSALTSASPVLLALGGRRAAGHGNMCVYAACDDGFACLRALSSDDAAQTQPSLVMGRKLVSGRWRIDKNSIYSGAESVGFGWASLEPPFVIAVLRYPSYPWPPD